MGAEEPEDGAPVEFTWKTELCTCDDWEQGQLLREALYRAGIESWTEPPYAREYGIDFKILVAADQLEEALKIAAHPIAKEVVEDSKIVFPEFVPPVCPHCGTGDPVLEGVEDGNLWICEACGGRWTDLGLKPADGGGI